MKSLLKIGNAAGEPEACLKRRRSENALLFPCRERGMYETDR